MKQTLESEKNLSLIQAEIVDFETEHGAVSSVITKLGAQWKVKAAVICTGTYLRGKIIIGDVMYEAGPDGMLPARGLEAAFFREGIALRRFKTGTPPRVDRDSIDFSKLEVQPGDDYIKPFSLLTDETELNSRSQLPAILYIRMLGLMR